MFESLDVTKEICFAETLAEILIGERMILEGSGGRKDEEKKQKLLARVAAQVSSYRQFNRINFYKRARLLNVFKWKLLDAGFAPALTDELTSFLIFRL